MNRSSTLPWIDSTIIRRMAALLVIFLQVGLSAAALAQTGVVAWKEQPFHADSTAKVYYFERMEKTGPVTWFFRGRNRIVLEPHQKFEVLFIPESIEELESRTGSKQLREDFDRLSAFAKKYPAAATLLKKRLDQMEMYLQTSEVAAVKTKGEWVPVAEYDKIIEEENKPVAPPLKPNHRTMVYVVCAVYLLVLLVFTLWRKRTPVLLLLVLPFVAAFGWFTYKDKGFGWVKRVNQELREAYQDLGLH